MTDVPKLPMATVWQPLPSTDPDDGLKRICRSCSGVPGLEILGQDVSGRCAACGGDGLNRRVLIHASDLERVKAIDTKCFRCGRPWRVFPHELHRAAKGAASVEMRCYGCKKMQRFEVPRHHSAGPTNPHE